MGVLDFLSEDRFSSSSRVASSAAASASTGASDEQEDWHLVDKEESVGEESLNNTAQVYAVLAAAQAGGAGRQRTAPASSVVVRPSTSMEDLESGFHLVSPVSTT